MATTKTNRGSHGPIGPPGPPGPPGCTGAVGEPGIDSFHKIGHIDSQCRSFVIDKQRYVWHGCYTTIFTSLEKGRKVGDIRFIGGILFVVVQVLKADRWFGPQVVSWGGSGRSDPALAEPTPTPNLFQTMSENTSSRSLPVASILGIAFVILKLCGVIDWSWWWVTLPFWGWLALWLVIILGCLLFGGLCLLLAGFLALFSRK